MFSDENFPAIDIAFFRKRARFQRAISYDSDGSNQFIKVDSFPNSIVVTPNTRTPGNCVYRSCVMVFCSSLRCFLVPTSHIGDDKFVIGTGADVNDY